MIALLEDLTVKTLFVLYNKIDPMRPKINTIIEGLELV